MEERARTRQESLHSRRHHQRRHQSFIGGRIQDRPNDAMHVVSSRQETIDLRVDRDQVSRNRTLA